MPYSIPSDEEVLNALHYVMRRNRGVKSLTKLRNLVIKELQNKDPEYTVGFDRLRKIAVTAPFIKTEIAARTAETGKSLKGSCPVCEGKLDRTKNETIFGGTVTLGYKCERCPYWTGLNRRIPTKYHFEFKKTADKKEDGNNGNGDRSQKWNNDK